MALVLPSTNNSQRNNYKSNKLVDFQAFLLYFCLYIMHKALFFFFSNRPPRIDSTSSSFKNYQSFCNDLEIDQISVNSTILMYSMHIGLKSEGGGKCNIFFSFVLYKILPKFTPMNRLLMYTVLFYLLYSLNVFYCL